MRIGDSYLGGDISPQWAELVTTANLEIDRKPSKSILEGDIGRFWQSNTGTKYSTNMYEV
ncbi:MAG: hypothetical protein R3B93_27180 [Bacteroidia bacterium]